MGEARDALKTVAARHALPPALVGRRENIDSAALRHLEISAVYLTLGVSLRDAGGQREKSRFCHGDDRPRYLSRGFSGFVGRPYGDRGGVGIASLSMPASMLRLLGYAMNWTTATDPIASACCAPVFDAAEVIFDFVASPVEALGTIGFLGGVAAAGDDRQSALILDLLTHFLAIVGLVGGDG